MTARRPNRTTPRRADATPRVTPAALLLPMALAALPAGGAASALHAQPTPPAERAAADLSEYQAGVETRWASPENPTGAKGGAARENRGAKGHPFETIPAGGSIVLADVAGAGTIRRIWITVSDRSPEMLRSLKLEMYWDGAATPAVAAPLGDFFGVGLGQTAAFESALFASPEGRSFVSYVPMPFRTRARLVLTNESGRDLTHAYYDVAYTRVPRQSPNAMYFHAHWRRERPTRLGEPFRVLPRVAGRGRYLGTNVGVVTDASYGRLWWGEGEVQVYLDGDREHPTLAGTGSEDYIGSAWEQGTFAGRYQGSLVADRAGGRWAFYRYHVPDPVFFARDCEVVLQQLGGGGRDEVLRAQQAGARLAPVATDAGGRPTYTKLLERDSVPPLAQLPEAGVVFTRADDVSAVAYFYLDRPEDGLPRLAPVAERTAGTREPPRGAAPQR